MAETQGNQNLAEVIRDEAAKTRRAIGAEARKIREIINPEAEKARSDAEKAAYKSRNAYDKYGPSNVNNRPHEQQRDRER